MGEILRTDGRTGPSRVVDELLAGHLLFLLGVVRVGGEHDDGIGEGEELIGVVVIVDVALVEGEGELPNDPLDLLRLSRQPEFAEQRPEGLVELLPRELEQLAVGVQHIQHLLVILAEVFSQDGLIDALNLDDILGDGIRTVLVNEPLCNVIVDGVLGLLVEHEDEELCLLVEALVLVDVVELAHQIAVPVLLVQPPSLQVQGN